MDLLIKHGTWMIVPGGLALAFIYSHLLTRLYPFIMAHRLNEEDRLRKAPRLVVREFRYKPKPSTRTVTIP